MADLSAKKVLVIEKSNILFCAITGEGIDNYEKDGKLFKVAQEISKAEEKRIRKEVLAFYQANKSASNTKDEPANWENITYVTSDGDRAVSAHTNTEINGKPQNVTLVDGEKNPLDKDKYGNIGKGSTGRISINLKMYTSGKKEGVSLYLNAVQLATFVPYEGGGNSANDFDTIEGDDLDGDTGFKEKKKKKKGKKHR